jgi:hypothetical protein
MTTPAELRRLAKALQEPIRRGNETESEAKIRRLGECRAAAAILLKLAEGPQDERQAFETFAKEKFGAGMLERAPKGHYAWNAVNDAWGIWQARASLGVARQEADSGQEKS